MTTQEQKSAAKAFAIEWGNRGDEKSETQSFWMSLLRTVFEIAEPQKFIEFEKRVQLAHVSFIDAYIEATKVLIEQKSSDVDLHKGYKQSDGSILTPFQQAKRYANELPYSLRPRWVVVSNFQSFLVYDMENPNGEPIEILLENFDKEYYRLSFLTATANPHLKKEMEVSIKAGDLVGKIYDALLPQYKDPTSAETLHSLNMLCVRLVFCLYAEDAGVFGKRSMFHDYMSEFDARNFRRALIDLFKVLDTKVEDRDPYMDEALSAFPYVNGGLFSDCNVEIPNFTDELRALILEKASDDFDWSEISPTIFGAVFESTLNPVTRRSGGMHYTSIENIHKVIDPLFFNDLRREFDEIKAEKVGKLQTKKAAEFQMKLSELKFLDPACGSGNFLTETYLSLRRLENEAIRLQTKGQVQMGFEETNPVKVSIHQFYGIEINDFAADVATTALWIAESQMLKETSSIVDFDLDMLPLKTYHNIKKGNALRLSWTEWPIVEERTAIIAKRTNVYPMQDAPTLTVSEPPMRYNNIDLYSDEINLHPKRREPETYRVDFDYIMGNPPFVGHQMTTESQKNDIQCVFGGNWKNVGRLDYVSCWYLRASQVIKDTKTRVALVSTNSVTQGEQTAALWKPLFEKFGIHIDFAYRTFRWDSESTLKAHVHCVIIGFSHEENTSLKVLYTDKETQEMAHNISPYLIDAPTVFIESRKKSICDVPEIRKGNQPTDGGNLIIEESEYADFIKKEPIAQKYIKRLLGADEYINNKNRYCLWLVDASPNELRQMPLVMGRIKKVREMRLNSTDATTRRKADTPHLFRETNNPKTFIVIPSTSSEKRRYIPLGFLDENTIPTNANLIIPDATLYHFGILTSNVHMAWMRVVCGRLKSDYRYSKDIVYNNFPWPTPTDEQKAKIEQTAQAILDARAKYPESSLADLYDDVTMPPELRKAHKENDHAVMAAYGFKATILSSNNESQIVAELFRLYQTIIEQEQ